MREDSGRVVAKSFANVTKYQREIRCLVPGYDAYHTLLPHMASVVTESSPSAAALVIGCGPGDEVLSLARHHPGWRVDAVDVEHAMVSAARATVGRAGLASRVRIAHADASALPWDGVYDVVVASLVGHLIDGERARRAFFAGISSVLTLGGVAIFFEPICCDAWAEHCEAHLAWAGEVGLSDARLAMLRDRLAFGFSVLNRSGRDTMQAEVGLGATVEFFKSLSFTAWASWKMG